MIHDLIFFSPGCLPVFGVGTVEIPTKRSPNRSGVASHGSLHLKHVLHVPHLICNVIGCSFGFSDGYNVQTLGRPTTKGTIKDSRGRNVAYFDPKRPLFCIKFRQPLQGPRLGPYVLRKGTMYMLSCRWDPSEQQRWLDYQAESGPKNLGSEPARATDNNPPYTDAEKAFLKATWRNVYHFLLQHGLKIYREDDRVMDRLILRALMHEACSDDDRLDRESSDCEDDDEFEFIGRQADHNFSYEQLEWIETHYGNSKTFMVSYGLRSYDFEDFEKSKAIVDTFLSEEY